MSGNLVCYVLYSSLFILYLHIIYFCHFFINFETFNNFYAHFCLQILTEKEREKNDAPRCNPCLSVNWELTVFFLSFIHLKIEKTWPEIAASYVIFARSSFFLNKKKIFLSSNGTFSYERLVRTLDSNYAYGNRDFPLRTYRPLKTFNCFMFKDTLNLPVFCTPRCLYNLCTFINISCSTDCKI